MVAHLRPRLLRPRRLHAAARVATPATLDAGGRDSSRCKTALAYIPPPPLGLTRQGVPRRDALHRAQPAVRRRLHLLPEGRAEDPQAQGAPGRREGGATRRAATIAYPSLADARAPRRARRIRRSCSTVTDAEGNVVRRLTGPAKAGVQRVAWDLRFPPAQPTRLTPPPADNPFIDPPDGPLAVPGRYTVSFETRVDGVLTPFGDAAELRGRVARPADAEDGGRGGAPRLPAQDRAPAARRARRGRGRGGGAGAGSRRRRRRSTTLRRPLPRSVSRRAASSARSTT